MSTFSGLNTAYTGLVAAKAGLDVVGQNLVNASCSNCSCSSSKRSSCC